MISVLPAKLPSHPHSPPHPFPPSSNPTCGPVGPISCSEVALPPSPAQTRPAGADIWPPSPLLLPPSPTALSPSCTFLLASSSSSSSYIHTELCSAEDWVKSYLHFVGFFLFCKKTDTRYPTSYPSLSQRFPPPSSLTTQYVLCYALGEESSRKIIRLRRLS